MTSLAILECKIATEGTIAVVTANTRLAASCSKMLKRRRRADLARLRRTRAQRMTIRTGKPLPAAVFCMTEGIAIRARIGARARKRLLLMTNAAGSELATGLRSTARRVTRVTLVMSGDTRRN